VSPSVNYFISKFFPIPLICQLHWSTGRLCEVKTMDYPQLPPNTFRPIQNAADLEDQQQQQQQWCHLTVGSSGQGSFIRSSPLPSPLPRSSSRLTKALWRQGSDNWSSTGGSRQSSRPGSAAAQAAGGSRPPSTSHMSACRSGNSSTTTDVSRNFQQLSVSTRRAAFKTQKWSHSFDQTCLTSAAPASSPGGGVGPGARRRQSSLQQKSLDLDSGYLGSPASSGLASHSSQSWIDNSSGCGHTHTEGDEDASGQLEQGGGLQLEGAKRELARLITSQTQETFLRSASLPSFPESFPVLSLPEDQGVGQDCSRLFGTFPEPMPVQEELDALDEEIKRIVGDVASGGRQPDAKGECLRPRPVNTSFFPALVAGSRVPSLDRSAGQVDEGDEDEDEEDDEGDNNNSNNSSSSSKIMLAVVSTVSQTYHLPRHLAVGQASLMTGHTVAPSASSWACGGGPGWGGGHAVAGPGHPCDGQAKAAGTASTLIIPWKYQQLGNSCRDDRLAESDRTTVSLLQSASSDGGGGSESGRKSLGTESESVRASLGPSSQLTASPRFVFKKTSQFSGMCLLFLHY